jgi:hypothetical protein
MRFTKDTVPIWAGVLLLGTAAVLLLRGRRGRGVRPPVTQAIVPTTPADVDLGEPGRNQEARLDEAVMETFPASDPIATHIE